MCNHRWRFHNIPSIPVSDGQIVLFRAGQTYAAIKIESQTCDEEGHMRTVRYSWRILPPGVSVFTEDNCESGMAVRSGTMLTLEIPGWKGCPFWSGLGAGRGRILYPRDCNLEAKYEGSSQLAIIGARTLWGLDAADPAFVYKWCPLDGAD